MSEQNFEEVFLRLRKLGIKTQRDLAEVLGKTPGAVSEAKKRGIFPVKWADSLSKIYDKSLDSLLGLNLPDAEIHGEGNSKDRRIIRLQEELLASKDISLEAQKEISLLQRKLFEAQSSVSKDEIMAMFQELKDGHNNREGRLPSDSDQEALEDSTTKTAKKKKRTSPYYSNHPWKGWKEEERGLAINE